MFMKMPMTCIISGRGPTIVQVTWCSHPPARAVKVGLVAGLERLLEVQGDVDEAVLLGPVDLHPARAGLAVAGPGVDRADAGLGTAVGRCMSGSMSSHGDHAGPLVEVGTSP